MRSRVQRALASCLALLLAGALASAQDWRGTGRIEGVVQDESGQPIVDASINALCAERGGGTTIKSDKKGRFVLGGVVASNWAFDVEAAGYEDPQDLDPLAQRVRTDGAFQADAQEGRAFRLAGAAGGRGEGRRRLQGRPLRRRPRRVREAARAAAGPAPTIYQQIGFSYVQEKQFAKAVESLEKVLASDPATRRCGRSPRRRRSRER